MKIDNLETFLIESPIDDPFAWSQGRATSRAALICKITTDDGLVGWGEGGGAPSQTVIHECLAPLLEWEDLSNINRLWHRMFHRLHNDEQTGGFGGEAISSIDIALWDLAGKAAGKSISELLGGALRDRVAVYATGLYYTEEEFPDKLIEEAQSYLEAGYQGMKTKVGGLSVVEDVKRVAAIREAIGDDTYLMVDANKAYSVATAIDMGNRLADLNIHWFEEPVMAGDIDGYLQVMAGQPLALAGGETKHNRFEIAPLLRERAVHIVQPDVRFIGGISEFRTVAGMANTLGIQVNPHVWGSPVMISASLSLASIFPPCPYARMPRPYEQETVMEFDQTPNPIRNDLASRSFEQKGGYVSVPDGPGLGIEIDESVLRKLCVRHCSFKR